MVKKELTPEAKHRQGHSVNVSSVGSDRRRNVVVTSIIAVCAFPLALAIANFVFGNWPPSKRTFDPLSGVNGVINVHILDAGLRGLRSYLYEVRAGEGQIHEVANESISSEEFGNPPWSVPVGGHLDTRTSHSFAGVSSPDGRYVAIPSESGNGSNDSGQVSVVVEQLSDHSEIVQSSISSRYYVRGVAWSPDSRAVAFLLSSERSGFGPLDLLSAVSGHPVRYKSFGVLILSVEERKAVGSMRFAGGYSAGWAAIDWKPLRD